MYSRFSKIGATLYYPGKVKTHFRQTTLKTTFKSSLFSTWQSSVCWWTSIRSFGQLTWLQ